jgi:hypothetical protein
MGPSLLSSIVGVERVCSGRKSMATRYGNASLSR